MIELIKNKVQELNVILAEKQRETRGTPQYDQYDLAMEILNGPFREALNEAKNNNT